jgi:hypothetical protein
MGALHWYKAPSGAELLIEEDTAQHEYVTATAGFVEIDGPGGDAVGAEASEAAKASAPEVTAIRVTTDGGVFSVEALAGDVLVQTKSYKTEKGARNAASRAASKLGLTVTETSAEASEAGGA